MGVCNCKECNECRNKEYTILTEKHCNGFDLNSLSHATAKQDEKSKSSRKSEINEASSKWLTSSFSPTTKKSRKKCQVSQSNTIDIWLNKREKQDKGKREKENQKNEHKQIEFGRNKFSTESFSSKTSIKNIHSQTAANNCSTKNYQKVSDQNNFKETSSSSNKSLKERSEKESKSTKVESCSSHQGKLENYLNNEDKQNKHKVEKKKLQPTTNCPTSSRISSKEDDHKKKINGNKEPTRKNIRPKAEVENPLEKPENPSMSSDSSIKKRYKRIKSPVDDDKIDKSTLGKGERNSKTVKVGLHSSHQRKLETYQNNEDKRNKRKDDNKKLQPTASCSSSGKTSRKDDNNKEISNNNKEPIRKNRSKAEVEKSLGKQRNISVSSDSSIKKTCNKQVKSSVYDTKTDKLAVYNKTSRAAKDDVWLSKHKYKDRSKTKYDELSVKISSNRSTENVDDKNKSSKRSESKTESGVRNSRDKQENLDKKNKSSRKRSRSKTTQDQDTSKSYGGQKKLDGYLIKNLKPNNKRKLIRSDSNESCEFPSFQNITKKNKKTKKDEFFQKYGVSIPSVEEILREQKDLEKYRKKIQSFEKIENKYFELPFSIEDLNRTEETYDSVDILDCKHLSIDEITVAFRKNLKHITDIFHGRKFNERHEKYFNNTNYALMSVNDLCCSTSMIVFNFDQKEHMISLLKDEFDPNDKWTTYFFQVLLPELCMKIFMDAHEMTYDETVKYLDTRPIVDD